MYRTAIYTLYFYPATLVVLAALAITDPTRYL